MDDEYSGNGHDELADTALEETQKEAFAGGRGDLANLKRPDGILTQSQRQYASVLQQSMHAIKDDEDFRQELKTAFWLSVEESDDWCNAYSECQRYGAPVDWLINRLLARSAGVEGGRLKAIFETISHTTFTTNYMNQKKGMFGFLKGKNDGKQSPISQ